MLCARGTKYNWCDGLEVYDLWKGRASGERSARRARGKGCVRGARIGDVHDV